MKAILAGFVTLLVIGVIAVLALRGRGLIPTVQSLPSPSPAGYLVTAPSPTPSATPLPTPTPASTTKGGQTLGSVTTKNIVTTREAVTHTTITLAKVSKCPSEVISELKGITSPLTLNYQIKSGYSAAITVWGNNNIELQGQTTYTGDGRILATGSNTYLKVLVQPSQCPAAEDNWMQLTASR